MREMEDVKIEKAEVEKKVVEDVEEEKKEPTTKEIEEAIIKTAEFDERIREAVRSAIKEVFEEFLTTEKEKEEESIGMETKKEEFPKCPRNLSWLQKMFEIFPEEILKNSKLWKYKHCLEQKENE